MTEQAWKPAVPPPPIPISKDPLKGPKITKEAVAKMSPQEKTSAHVGHCVALLRSIETETAEALLTAFEEGAMIEGAHVEHPDVRDIVVFVIDVNSAYLPEPIRKLWKSRGQTLGFLLRDRVSLSEELCFMGFPHGAKLGSGSRAERRKAAETAPDFPWRDIGLRIKNRLVPPPADPTSRFCHYAVVLDAQIIGCVFPFKFNLEETRAAVAESKAAKAAVLAAEEKLNAKDEPASKNVAIDTTTPVAVPAEPEKT